MRVLCGLIAAALGVLVSTVAGSAQDTPAPSYSKDVAPFFKKYCGQCHNAKIAKSGFVLDNYDDLIRGSKKGKKGIVPGNPDDSWVLRTLEGKARRMPPAKNTQPDKSEVKLIRAWVADGAKNDPAPDAKSGASLFSAAPRDLFALTPELFAVTAPPISRS